MGFHAMVVIAPIFILLLESIWACCAETDMTQVEKKSFLRKDAKFSSPKSLVGWVALSDEQKVLYLLFFATSPSTKDEQHTPLCAESGNNDSLFFNRRHYTAQQDTLEVIFFLQMEPSFKGM